jgi:hypothetical protein
LVPITRRHAHIADDFAEVGDLPVIADALA